jgi:hypothetical protein
MRISAATAALVAGLLVLSAATMSGATTARASAVTAVVFSGSPSAPVVTITGRGLSVPVANPSYSPSNRPLCPKVIHGDAGRDFGTSFYLTVYQASTFLYAAGRYRPSLNELDCIGLVVLSAKSTVVRFELGAAYQQASFGYSKILNGDRVQLVLNGSDKTITVHYP